ncbi:coproporphyrinogen III oxidase [Leptolyngbya sp. FACHB-36]|uniref:radical SAM family heme chaperone HemW n=1 Tax=Leptolyngbya sp. FACHB-36 TaxID=2692808 RepID=UPI0016819276|nr:radical SAM family heme chaperone HemW [Leptolyngbya sp. FACHB-36]MBD2020275.1 coproporphyrinogen III oxidase [Leptolyngbya sp. FACHB-36]
MLLSGAALETSSFAGVPQSAYVHIPFCRRRCYYCDFPISVVGDKPPVAGQGGYGTIAYYVAVLSEEIRLTQSWGSPLTTVFFGGGTPSLLTVEQLHTILQTLDRQFGISANAEISMEIDPGTFDLAQVQGYRSAGVNRVSLGVQAFQAELLAACGRSHSVEDVYGAVETLRQAAFDNLSLDLISGLPHQTLDDWNESLQRAIALAPTHVSCYDLTVESGTPFSRQYKPGMSPLPSDDTTAQMYRLASETLRSAGYEHYEISNYAKRGHQCRHNRVYWENHPFYGFGMGATSFVGGDRVARPRKTREYYDWVKQSDTVEFKTQTSASSTHTSEFLLDTLMLGLRLADGLSIAKLRSQFGRATLDRVWRCLQPYYQKGWVEVLSEQLPTSVLPDTGRLRLSDPDGFLFSNVILVRLFEKFE